MSLLAARAASPACKAMPLPAETISSTMLILMLVLIMVLMLELIIVLMLFLIMVSMLLMIVAFVLIVVLMLLLILVLMMTGIIFDDHYSRLSNNGVEDDCNHE